VDQATTIAVHRLSNGKPGSALSRQFAHAFYGTRIAEPIKQTEKLARLFVVSFTET
jgi:hypothetical protein